MFKVIILAILDLGFISVDLLVKKTASFGGCFSEAFQAQFRTFENLIEP